MNWTAVCLSWPVFFSSTHCARSIHISLVFISTFSSRRQFTLSSHSSRVLFFPSFIPLIIKLFLLERSWWSTSLFLISIAQLGLVAWMTSMSFLRLNRFISIVGNFSFNLLIFSLVSSWLNYRLSFRSAISLLRLSSLWFVSIVFREINCVVLFSWLLNISFCFFVILSWCYLKIFLKIFLISSTIILVDPLIAFPELIDYY